MPSARKYPHACQHGRELLVAMDNELGEHASVPVDEIPTRLRARARELGRAWGAHFPNCDACSSEWFALAFSAVGRRT